MGICDEDGPCRYSPNKVTKELASEGLKDGVKCLSVDILFRPNPGNDTTVDTSASDTILSSLLPLGYLDISPLLGGVCPHMPKRHPLPM